MTTAEQKRAYDTTELNERSETLQHEAMDDKTGGGYL